MLSRGGEVLETALYRPVKNFLEGLGFAAKGEIGGCDLVALKGEEPPVVVIGELKQSFNLELVLQGVDRAAAGDEVWLAARLSVRGKGRESDTRFRNLCRRLGFGMLGVTPAGQVEILVSPTAPTPRKDPRRRSRLVDEHQRRRGRHLGLQRGPRTDHEQVSNAHRCPFQQRRDRLLPVQRGPALLPAR